MPSPGRYILRSSLFLVLVAAVAAALNQIALQAFWHNPLLNGLILAVLLVGVIYSFRRILVLRPELDWIEAYRTQRPGFSLADPPRLLSPVAATLREHDRRSRLVLNAASVRHILDSIGARLDESRDIARYLTGLLIFLGLLGTFWGLLATIGSVSEVIAGLTVGEGDYAATFDEMKEGLAAPLDGMGTAFSSSLFGLTGSLILGFLDLQSTQAQNAFTNELEEWLASLTRFGEEETSPAPRQPAGPTAREIVTPDRAAPAFVQAMIQQNAEQLNAMQRLIERSERQREGLIDAFSALNERLATLDRRMEHDGGHLQRLVETQEQLIGLAAGASQDGSSMRSLDARLAALTDELREGRSSATDDLRREIRMVARTIAIAAGDPSLVEEPAETPRRRDPEPRAHSRQSAQQPRPAASSLRPAPPQHPHGQQPPAVGGPRGREPHPPAGRGGPDPRRR